LPAAAQSPAPTPRFTDPERRAKLEAALPEIEKVFEQFWQERKAPGLVFGVVIDGEVVMMKGYGVRERATNDPVTPDTVFRIASMTKSFTALAILKLRDEGKLSLDDPVAKWIPEFARMSYPTSDAPPITIRHLLTHGAGFPEDNPWGDRQLGVSDETMTQWLKAGIPFSTPPNTEFEYSNYGFALLGRIVTRVSGVPYRDYVEKNILAPLGMRTSTLEPSAVPRSVVAMGYRREGDSYAEEPLLPHGAFGAMGGLLTSARDLGKYVAYMLSAFPARDGADNGPVRRSSVREMQQPWRASFFGVGRPAPDEPVVATAASYAYGLGVRRDCRFAQAVGHGGGLPGFGSYMGWLPEYGVGLFAMTNLTYTGPGSAVDQAFDILRKTGALKPRELPVAPVLESTRAAIVRLWDKWNDAEAEALAADNLFLDRPAAERRKTIEQLKEDLGACRPSGDIEPENLLRGKFRMTCEQGHVDVYFTLAPTQPPKVQSLGYVPARTPDDRMKSAAETVASLIMTFQEESLAALAAPSLDRARLQRQLDALRVFYGACRVGETLGGDGRQTARLRLECDRGPLNVSLRLDENHKLTSASFSRPPDVTCVP
jgi:CubicO group peptidase (beta-lactamase class C family)